MTDRQLVAWIIDRHEGTEFSDRKHDRGGPTKFGITLRLYSAYMGREMTVDALKELTKDLAIDILYSEFCFKPKLAAIHDERVKLCAIDFAIHSGPVHAVRSVQYGVSMTLPHDGVLGALTQAGLNATDPAKVHRRMLAYRLRFLSDLVKNDPTQADHRGWWNRLANLIELPADLSPTMKGTS